MREIYKDILYKKNILVSEELPDVEECFESQVILAWLFGVKVVYGAHRVGKGVVREIDSRAVLKYPDIFYSGFPDHVLKWMPEELRKSYEEALCRLFRYGRMIRSIMGDHLIDDYVDQLMAVADVEAREFLVLTEQEAEEKLEELFKSMISGAEKIKEGERTFLENYTKDYVHSAKKWLLYFRLRHCQTEFEAEGLISQWNEPDSEIYIQLLLIFSFHEKEDLYAHAVCRLLKKKIRMMSRHVLGKIFIDPGMKRIAYPGDDSFCYASAIVGFYNLSPGSRLTIKDSTVRAFLSWGGEREYVFLPSAVFKDGSVVEYTLDRLGWGPLNPIQSRESLISGFSGITESFDVDLEDLSREHTEIRYLLFTCRTDDIIYANQGFGRTGLAMINEDTGEEQVFHQDNISGIVNLNHVDQTMLLFAIDLYSREFIWLHTPVGNVEDKGGLYLDIIERYAHSLDVFNVYEYLSLLAEELVEDPEDADYIFKKGRGWV